MKKKKMLINLLTVALLIGFTLSLISYFNQSMEPVHVVAFNRTIAEDEYVSESDVTLVEIPGRSLKQNMVRNIEDIVGKYTNNRVYAGHYAFTEQFKDAEMVDPFKTVDFSLYHKIPMSLTYATGLGGDFKPGDIVDLYFVGEGRNAETNTAFFYSERFMTQVIVYKVLTKDGMTYDNKTNYTALDVEVGENMVGENVQVAKSEKEFAQIILLLKPEQVEEFLTREKAGTVRVAGTFGDTPDFETGGFVIGDYVNIFSGRVKVEPNNKTNFGLSNDPIEYYNPTYPNEPQPGMGEFIIEEVLPEVIDGSNGN